MKKIFPVLACVVVIGMFAHVVYGQRVTIPEIGGKNTPKTAKAPATAPKPLVVDPEKKSETASDAESLKKIPEIEEGQQLFAKGDFLKAKDKFLEARKNNPQIQPGNLFMAHMFSASGNFHLKETRYWLEQAVFEAPDDPEAYLLLGNYAVSEGRLVEARLLTEKSSELMKNFPQDSSRSKPLQITFQSLCALIAISQENWDVAKEHLLKMQTLDPDSPKSYFELGNISFRQDKLDESLKYYEEAFQKGAKIQAPKLIIAQKLQASGKQEEASQYLNESLDTLERPDDIRLAAEFFLRWGDLDQAEKLTQKAVELEPKHVNNLILQGTIALFKKDYPAAEQLFQDVILIAPLNLLAKQGLACALAESSDQAKQERAIAYAGDIVQNSPPNSPQRANSIAVLLWTHFKAGHQHEIEVMARPLLENRTELNSLGLYYLAEILVSLKYDDIAKELLQTAIDRNDNFFKKAEAETLLQKLQPEK